MNKKNVNLSPNGSIKPLRHYLLTIMRTFLLLITIGLSSAFANSSYSQVKINIDVVNVTFEDLFKDIQNKSEFIFFYKDELLKNKNRLSLNLKEVTIFTILDKAFSNTNLTYKIKDRQIVIKKSKKLTLNNTETIQDVSISGTVVDINGIPLPGANILEKGTTNGTQTDFDGEFRLDNLASNAAITVTYLGYTPQEINISGKTTINVVLIEAAGLLEEVVITALGIKKEARSVGYAVTEIEGEELAKASVVNPVNSLQGKAAGVQVSTTSGGTYGGSRITIRGNSTFDSNTQPIFVIDGVILDNEISGTNGSDWGNQLKNLNPDDFESLSILKGAAASALYGSRAINGVVLITTKKGSKQSGIGVSINQSTGTRFIYDTVDFQNEYGSGPTVGGFSWVWAGPGATERNDKHDASMFFATDNATGLPTLANNSGEEHAASWGPRFDGQEIIDYDGSRARWEAQPNNYKDFFDTGFLTNTNVAIQGGGETNSFRLSMSNLSETGVSPGNDFSKYSLSINGAQDLIKDKLKVGVVLHYTRSKAENPVNPGANSPWFHDGFPRNYDVNKWRNNYKAPDGGIPYPHGGYYNHTRMSKIWLSTLDNNNQRVEGSMIAAVNLNYNITDNISLKLEGNVNQYNTNNEFKTIANSANRLNGKYGIGHSEKFQNSFSAKMFFKKEINEDIHMDFLIGGDMWSSKREGSNVETDGGFKIPDFYSLSNSKNPARANASVWDRKKLNSLYGFYNISYKNELYLNLTARNDWSSTLVYPIDGHGDFSYFYPSASLAWVPSETFKLPKVISFLKLRTSYAIVGNDTGAWNLSTGFNVDTNNYGTNRDLFKYSNNQAITSFLKPEKKYSFETGLDIRLFNNRVKLDVAYYKDNNKNQIIGLPVPIESGIDGQLINAGNLQNQGVELAVDFTIIKNNDWFWSLGANATHNEDKIISLAPGINEFKLFGNPDDSNAGTASYAYVGGSYGDLVTRRGYAFYDGANTENHGVPILWNRNGWSVAYMPGIANKSTLHKMGNMQADWYGGVNTLVKYKNFSLSAIVDARFGGEIYSADARYGMHQGVLQSSVANRDAGTGGITWTSDGQGQNVFGKTYNDGYIPNGAFPDGTLITSGPAGSRVQTDVSGLTYQQAYEQGLVEPTHYSGFVYRHTSASTGTPETGVFEQNWIALRELSVNYTVPSSILEKTFIKSADLSLTGRDLGLLYNSMPDNINPVISSNAAANPLQMRSAPYIGSVTFAIKLNL